MINLKKGHTKELFNAQWHPDVCKYISSFLEDGDRHISAFEIDDETLRIKASTLGISHAKAKHQAIESLSGKSAKQYNEQYKMLLESLYNFSETPVLWSVETPRVSFESLPITGSLKNKEDFQPKKMYQKALKSLKSASRWQYLKENTPSESIFTKDDYKDIFFEYFWEKWSYDDSEPSEMLIDGIASILDSEFYCEDDGMMKIYESYPHKVAGLAESFKNEYIAEYGETEGFESTDDYDEFFFNKARSSFGQLNYTQLCEIYGDHTDVFKSALDAIGYKKEYRDELYNSLLILSLTNFISLENFGRRFIDTVLLTEEKLSDMIASLSESIMYVETLGADYLQRVIGGDFAKKYDNIHICVSITPDIKYADHYDRYLDDSNLIATFYTTLSDGTSKAIGKIEAQYIVPLVKARKEGVEEDDNIECVPDLFILDYMDLGAFRTLMERYVPRFGAVIEDKNHNGWTFGYCNAVSNNGDDKFFSGAIMDIKAFEFEFDKNSYTTDFSILPEFLKLLDYTIGDGECKPNPIGKIENMDYELEEIGNSVLFPILKTPSVILMEVGVASKPIFENTKKEYDEANFSFEWDIQEANKIVFNKALTKLDSPQLPFFVYYHESNSDFSHPFVMTPIYKEA